jgi:hypothetical protein
MCLTTVPLRHLRRQCRACPAVEGTAGKPAVAYKVGGYTFPDNLELVAAEISEFLRPAACLTPSSNGILSAEAGGFHRAASLLEFGDR